MNNNITRPVGFINFHGMTLLVLEHNGIEYVGARPLAELSGTNWKSARQTLLTPENVRLYGTKEIPEPRISLQTAEFVGGQGDFGSDITPEKTVLCLELEFARMYLARIDTSRMRSHGNEDGAERLLTLQKEWAKVLHAYETHGIAVKAERKSALAELLALINACHKASPDKKPGLNWLIDQQMQELGIPHDFLKDPQTSLPL